MATWWGYRIGMLQASNKMGEAEMLWGSCLRCCNGLWLRCWCRLNMPGARGKKKKQKGIRLSFSIPNFYAPHPGLQSRPSVQCVWRDRYLKNIFTWSRTMCRWYLEVIHNETWKKKTFLNAFVLLKCRCVDSVCFPTRATLGLKVHKTSKRKPEHIF